MKPDTSIVTQTFLPKLQKPACLSLSLCLLARGRYDYHQEIALDYALLLTQLGIHE